MKRLKNRCTFHDTQKKTYFGWDLRQTEVGEVHWQGDPKLSLSQIEHWPYRFDPSKKGNDMRADFCVVVRGNPSPGLLTAWLEEEESGSPLTNVDSDED